MKRILSFFLLCASLLSFCACGAQTAAESTAAPISTKPAPTIQVVEGQPIEQLDDVSVYIPATGESKQPDEALPAYTYSEGETVAFKGMKKGRYEQETFVFNNTDAASFITYLQALEADGWQQYSNNIIEGTNLFATYTKDERSIYCYYISSKNRTSISLSPCQNLEVRKQDNQYEAVCAPLLTQIDLTHATRPNGMSYVIRLSDGRFVMDSGVPLKNMMSPVIRLRRLSDNELLALTLRLRALHAQYYGTEEAISDEMAAAFLKEELSRAGAEEMITPREIIRDFVTLLDLLYQNPGATFTDMMNKAGSAPVNPDPDGENASWQNANSEEESPAEITPPVKVELSDIEL
jgi:hypothetical protein